VTAALERFTAGNCGSSRDIALEALPRLVGWSTTLEALAC
jgi:hypothetical protein